MSIQQQDLRAVIWPLFNPDTGLMRCERFLWRELETREGIYALEKVGQAVKRAMDIKRYALIQIQPVPPGWSANPARDFIRLIGALGEAFGENRAISGVDVLSPGAEEEREEQAEIADAFCRAFPHAVKYVRAGSAFEGLLKDGERKGIIVTRESARQYADWWQSAPLRMAVDPTHPEQIQWAIDHHISILEADNDANTATHAGHRFAFLSARLDDSREGSRQAEVTVTFANAGTLPCYTDARFWIRLSGSDVDAVRAFPLPLRAFDVKPGDRISITQALDTEGMQPGEYDIQAGLFCEGTGYPISFGVEGRVSDGYYEGRLILTVKG